MLGSGGESVFNPSRRVFLLGGLQFRGPVGAKGADVLFVQCEYVSTLARWRNRRDAAFCRRFCADTGGDIRRQRGDARFFKVTLTRGVVEQNANFAPNLTRRQRPPAQRQRQRPADCPVAVIRRNPAQNLVIQQVVKG